MKTILITAILLSRLSGFAVQPLFAQRIRVMPPSAVVMVYPHFRPAPVVIGYPVVVLPAPMPPVPPAIIHFGYARGHCPHCHEYRNDCKKQLQQHRDPSPEDTNTEEKMPAGINAEKIYKGPVYTTNDLK